MKYGVSLQSFAEAQSESAETGDPAQTQASEAENAQEKSGEEETAQPSAEENVPAEENAERTDEASGGTNASAALKSLTETLTQLKKRNGIERVLAGWEREAEELRDTYPGFELGSQLQNGEFVSLLSAGVPLRRAYEAVNLESIIGTAMRYAALNAGKKAAETLTRQKSRPQENGVLDRASSVKHTDVRALTEKDILRILGEVSKGAKITFG